MRRSAVLATGAPRVPRVTLAPLALCLALVLAGCDGDAPDEASTPSPAPFAGANVILISLDTCRADALSLNGGPPGISEALDAFAQDAVVFDHARAQAPHTAPSHMSLFTSLYPSQHGVQNVQQATDPETGATRPLIEPVPESMPTLAELLRAAGYRTVGLTDGGNVNPAHGFTRGFDHYTKDLSGVEDQVADGLLWLDRLQGGWAPEGDVPTRSGDSPFFMFWHTYEIHAPYVPPKEFFPRWVPGAYDGPLKPRIESLEGLSFAQKFAKMRTLFWRNKEAFGWPEAAYLHGLYKAGVDYTDGVLAGFLDAIAERGLLEDTVVIVLSDHGEEFFEHGGWQHDQLYEHSLRVPLMVRLPGGRRPDGGQRAAADLPGYRVRTPVALVDVVPTLLELLGIDRSELGLPATVPFKGRSLAETLLEGREPPARPIVSEVRSDRKGGPLYDWMIAVHSGDAKFIYDNYRGDAEHAPDDPEYRGRDWRQHFLYDLASDPDERDDLAPQGGALVGRMLDVVRAYIQEVEALEAFTDLPEGAELDPESLQQLRELGYLDGGGD